MYFICCADKPHIFLLAVLGIGTKISVIKLSLTSSTFFVIGVQLPYTCTYM